MTFKILTVPFFILISIILFSCDKNINESTEKDSTSSNNKITNPESRILITTDQDAIIYIDSDSVRKIKKGTTNKFIVFPGEHYIEAISLDLSWSKKVLSRVNPGEQIIIELILEPVDKSIGIVGNFIDPRDKYQYKTITINGRTWLGENLRYKSYNSCAYENNENLIDQYGRLYMIGDAKSSIPIGWHMPTQQEWKDLLSLYENNQIESLLEGGKSNLDLVLGGGAMRGAQSKKASDWFDLNVVGRYWMNEPHFSGHHKKESAKAYLFSKSSIKEGQGWTEGFTNAHYFSVRCVKNY